MRHRSKPIWGLKLEPHYLLPARFENEGATEISEKEFLDQLKRGKLPPEIGIRYYTILEPFFPSTENFASTDLASQRLENEIKAGKLEQGQQIGSFIRIVNLTEKTIRPAAGMWYLPLGSTDLLLKTQMGSQVELQQALHLKKIFRGFRYSPVGRIHSPDDHPSGLLEAALKRRGRKTWRYLPLPQEVRQLNKLVRQKLKRDTVWKKLQRKDSKSRVPRKLK